MHEFQMGGVESQAFKDETNHQLGPTTMRKRNEPNQAKSNIGNASLLNKHSELGVSFFVYDCLF